MSENVKPDVELVFGEPVSVPEIQVLRDITRRQLRLWLHSQGISTAAVTALIQAIPDANAREIALIEWEDATVFQRAHPLIESIGTALGMTPTQLDEGWLNAAQL